MDHNALNTALASKQQRRHLLAQMPVDQKLRAVVKLQEMAAPILKKRGISRPIWKF
jgi:hypothetical protein